MLRAERDYHISMQNMLITERDYHVKTCEELEEIIT